MLASWWRFVEERGKGVRVSERESCLLSPSTLLPLFAGCASVRSERLLVLLLWRKGDDCSALTTVADVESLWEKKERKRR